jgi:membrane protein DedA with SNARE-associated domain
MKIGLSHRSTTEIVVLMFGGLISSVLLIMVMGAVVGKLIHPQFDMPNIVEAVTLMISNILGALIGFISGRAYGRREIADNGNQTKETKT